MGVKVELRGGGGGEADVVWRCGRVRVIRGWGPECVREGMRV